MYAVGQAFACATAFFVIIIPPVPIMATVWDRLFVESEAVGSFPNSNGEVSQFDRLCPAAVRDIKPRVMCPRTPTRAMSSGEVEGLFYGFTRGPTVGAD